MRIICEYCNSVIDRDKIVRGQIVEEYKNIYGTRCPECGKINKPDKDKMELTDLQIKMELLKKEVLDRLRNKIRR